MILDALDGFFIADEGFDMPYLIIDNFDEHFLDQPSQYGIVAYKIEGKYTWVYFNTNWDKVAFVRDYPNPRNPLD